MTVALLADHPRFLSVVELVDWLDDLARPTQQANISAWPSLVHDLTPVERAVLARVGTHCWTEQGSIPYHPPTAHLSRVAQALAAPAMRLLTRTAARRPTYILSRQGEQVVRQTLHVVDAHADRQQEREFDRMRAFMRNHWEVNDEDDGEA